MMQDEFQREEDGEVGKKNPWRGSKPPGKAVANKPRDFEKA
jgi:hypothetical protein